MIIDFHTHMFPDKIAESTIKTLEKSIEDVSRRSVKAVIGGNLDALKESMRINGIDYSVVLPIATTVTQSKTINNFAQSINGRDGIFSFGSLHPMQENWEETLEDIKKKGLLGIKLHPEYQQCYVNEKETIRILKKCRELGLYTVFHAGNDHGIKPPRHCTPKQLREALDYVEGDMIIAAHLGGWTMWDEVEKYLVGTPIMFDTAFTKDFIETEQLLRIIKNHGSKKILFATDSPWENQGDSAAFFKALPIEDNEKDDIMYKNAKKLLKIY